MTRPVMGELRFSGINRDKVPGDVDADWYTDGRNVMFLAGETLRVPGEAQYGGNCLFDVKALHYVDVGPQAYWIYAGDGGVGATDGVSHHNITPVGWGAIAGKNKIYTIGDLNGVPFVNHPERGPYYWDGVPANKMLPLPDWPPSHLCQVMRAHKYFLLAINIDTGTGLLESQVSWSSSAPAGEIPQYWVPSPTNDAGDVSFSTPGGPLIDGISVRDQFFIAKTNWTGALQYVGGQYVFQTRDVFPSTGVFAPNCMAEFSNTVWVLSGNCRLLRHDGNQISFVLYGVLDDYLKAQVNHEWPTRCFLYIDPEFSQLGVAYPVGTGTTATEAILVEGITSRPGIRDLPGVYGAAGGLTKIPIEFWDAAVGTWDTDDMSWNQSASGYLPQRLVFAGGSLGMIEQGRAVTQMTPGSGAAREMVAYAGRAGADLDDMDYRKTLTGAVPRVSGTLGQVLKFTFGGQASDNAPIELLPAVDYVVGVDDRLDFFMDQRLLSMEVRSEEGTPWQLAVTFLQARKAGRW